MMCNIGIIHRIIYQTPVSLNLVIKADFLYELSHPQRLCCSTFFLHGFVVKRTSKEPRDHGTSWSSYNPYHAHTASFAFRVRRLNIPYALLTFIGQYLKYNTTVDTL